MNISVDPAEGSVRLNLPRQTYSRDAMSIAAHVFSNRAEVYQRASKTGHELTLVAKRPDCDEAALESLGGEFLNELLNQEYRFIVARFNRKIADRISAQTLLSARGGENPKKPEADSPELAEQLKKLMAAAEAEIRLTMPKKLPPQGPLYTPPPDAR